MSQPVRVQHYGTVNHYVSGTINVRLVGTTQYLY